MKDPSKLMDLEKNTQGSNKEAGGRMSKPSEFPSEIWIDDVYWYPCEDTPQHHGGKEKYHSSESVEARDAEKLVDSLVQAVRNASHSFFVDHPDSGQYQKCMEKVNEERAKLLSLTRTVEPKEDGKYLKYTVNFRGDPDAGIGSFTDRITVIIESGDPGGLEGEFAKQLKDFLDEWYDGGLEAVKLEDSK